MFSIFKSE